MHFRALVITFLLLAPSACFAQTRATPGTVAAPVVEKPAPVLNIQPTAAPAPRPTLEQTQQALETAAEVAPKGMSEILAALAGAVGGIITLFGVQQALKQKDGKNQCPHCQGSGETPAVCSRCNGTKEVEQEYEPKMDCSHCEGSGEDPEERRDEHGKPLDCEECNGEGEISAKLNVSVPCPDCN